MQIVKIENNKNHLVKKHNDLIHARYILSEQAIKIISTLIAMIKKDDTGFQEYIIKVENFQELTGTNSNRIYEQVHRVIKELLSNPIKIEDRQFNWVSYGEYKKGTGSAIFTIHEKLKPYLLDLRDNYLTYDIKNVLPLKSSYVIRLYELCKNELNRNTAQKHDKKHTFEITVEEFRSIFEIPKSYLYDKIKERILEKAKEQFKEKTDITIEYKEIKLGRKVYALSISILENIKNSYLKDMESFIKYLKANHVNDDLIEYIPPKKLKTTISINTKGFLYSKNYLYTFSKKQSREIFEELYSRALDGKLPVLNQAKLF